MKQHISTLLLLRITPMRPLMLSVGRSFCSDEAEISFENFISWSVRFLISGGARSGGVEVALAEAARKVSAKEIRTARALADELKRVIPDDITFESAFSTVTVANHRLARYYLRTLERVQQNDPEPEWVPNDDPIITLEHVLPQHPGAEWPDFQSALHAAYYSGLGNMALLATTPNRFIGNDSFEDKKPKYLESTYRLTRDIAESNSWEPADIDDRQNRLAKVAVEAWPLTTDSSEQITACGEF